MKYKSGTGAPGFSLFFALFDGSVLPQVLHRDTFSGITKSYPLHRLALR
jgi:hypothetical protein